MRNVTRYLAACAAVLGVSAAVAQQPAPRADAPRQPDATPKALTDAEFVTKAASGGMFEVLSSKMAVEKATKADVKAFAEKMIADHSKGNEELKMAASKAGIAVPSTLAPHHEKMLQQLKGNPNFDAAYWDAQLKAHEEAVQVFAAGAAGAKDPNIRAFAEKTLPVIKTHYEHAKKHAGAGTRTGTSSR
jgi:putative membrane protein